MTLSVTQTSDHASPMRGLMPLWVGVCVYALFVLAGNRLLIDPDTMWPITVGPWSRAPSFWLLPLMALWANLHGGFVFGLVLMAPIALDAVMSADLASRKPLALRWAAFAVAALMASCCTPYGWNALLASQKILELG